MTVRLRAHHLLCMLTFVGKGYSPAFTANYRQVAARLSAGDDIVIVSGPDDVCAPLLGDAEAHCHSDSVVARDTRAAAAVATLLALRVRPGLRIDPDAGFLARLRTAFAAGEIRAACAGCEWSSFCTAIAGTGFAGGLLRRD